MNSCDGGYRKDADLRREKRPAEPDEATLVGKVVEIDESYSRQEPVTWYLLLPLMLSAGVAQTLGMVSRTLLRATFGAGGPGTTTNGGGVSWKQLRSGPEFAVTPLWVRQPDGQTVELEVHGYLGNNMILTGDEVRAHVRRQRRPDLPLRAVRVDNFTTGRTTAPHGPSLWHHLGLGLVIQAVVGVLVLATLVTCLIGGLH